MAHHLELGVAGQHLVMDAADPVPTRPDLAVGHRLERGAERSAEAAENILGGVERNAADQKRFAAHVSSDLRNSKITLAYYQNDACPGQPSYASPCRS